MTTTVHRVARRERVLVITADDFGYGAERDRGIVECFRARAITQATLMVQGQSAETAVKQAKTVGLPLGLHLNLTEGTPAAGPHAVSSLVGTDGFMLGKMGFREALQAGRVQHRHIEMEIQAQLDRFLVLVGAIPTFLDGHQHVHVLPGVREIVGTAMVATGVRWLRVPAEQDVESCAWIDPPRLAFYGAVVRDSREAAGVFRAHGIRFCQQFVGLSTMGRDMTVARLMEAFRRYLTASDDVTSQNDDVMQTCELMVHPGYPSGAVIGGCGDGPDEFAQSEDRIHEMTLLQSTTLKAFYEANDIQLLASHALGSP